MLKIIEHIKNNIRYILALIIFFIFGIIFHLIYHEKIVIFWASKAKAAYNIHQISSAKRKNFSLYYFKNNSWHKEDKDLIDSSNILTTLNYLVCAWINMLEEESLTQKTVALQSILIDQDGTEAFISFDRNPFLKESSVYEKLIWLEGLLKTIRKNKPQIKFVRFLVHHKPVNDPHLDFTYSWPVTGFLEQN